MLTRGVKQLLAEANAEIETLSVQDALASYQQEDVVLVDIRHTEELQREGSIPGAVHAPRGFLEFLVDPEMPMHNPVFSSDKRFILFCASGGRSALAAKTLKDMGLDKVTHVAGGYAAWREAQGPTQS